MWRVLSESVIGISHIRSGAVCQDYCFVSPLFARDENYILIACSDGAGSAKHSEQGSKLLCQLLVEVASEFLIANPFSDVGSEVLMSWARAGRNRLVVHAQESQIELRELACTLLFTIVGPRSSVFMQIGDGAIVVSEDGSYLPVFWPQTGEYHNTTNFLTSENYEEKLEFEIRPTAANEIAVFTDGIELLALHYASKTGHPRFFKPMFEALRNAEDESHLMVPFRQFLSSDAINARTDDDKTLVLAVRMSNCVTAPV